MEYLINSVEKATTKGGKTYLRLQLFESGGKVHKAIFWEDKDVKSGQVIDALAEEDSFNGEAQLKIKAMRVIEKDPGDIFLPRSKYSIDGMMKELEGFVAKIQSPKLHKLLEKAVADPRWKRAPAAKGMHHAFLGGLLEHVLELCRLSVVIKELYPSLDLDLLIAGSILHDIGKMDEMSCGVTIEYTTQGELVGHIVIGLLRISKWMDELEFDDVTRLKLIHLIESHHGNLNFGSPKEPATVEAQVFSNLDGISANMGKMAAAIERAKPDSEWSDKTDYKQRLWLGPVTSST